MKTATKVWASVIGLVTAALQIPGVQTAVVSALGNFLAHHTGIAALVGGLGSILALLHTPSKS